MLVVVGCGERWGGWKESVRLFFSFSFRSLFCSLARARARKRKKKNDRKRERPFLSAPQLTLDQEVAEARAGVGPALHRVRGPLGRVVLDRAADLGGERAPLVRAGGRLGDGRGRRGGGTGAGHCDWWAVG